VIVVVKGHAHQHDHRRNPARMLLFFLRTGFRPFSLKASSPVYCLPIESKHSNIFLEQLSYEGTIFLQFFSRDTVYCKTILTNAEDYHAVCLCLQRSMFVLFWTVNPLKPELNPICYLLALLGAHHFLHVSRIRVKLLTFRRLMLYIYGAPILDVSRSHATTQHIR